MLIRNYGLFWKADSVFWGTGGRGNEGKLLGVRAKERTMMPVDFREQRGVYVLYADYDLVYVGQVGRGNDRLLNRIKKHRTDSLSGRWNQFSWFGITRVLNTGRLAEDAINVNTENAQVLDHIEAILIHAAEPKQNRQGGRFGEKVEQYLQRRDKRLGPTAEEMIHEIWESNPTS